MIRSLCWIVLLSVIIWGCENPFLGRGTPDPLWIAAVPYGEQNKTNLDGADQTRFFTLVGGDIHAYRKADGELLWSSDESGYVPMRLIASGGRVYWAGSYVSALDAETGDELWRTPLPEDSSASVSDNTADDYGVYVGTRNAHLYVLDPATGAVRWSRTFLPDAEHETIVQGVAVSGDTVYAGIDQDHNANGYYSSALIVALDRETGDEHWRHRNGTGEDTRMIATAPVVAGDLLIAVDPLGQAFFAVDRVTGEEVWRVDTDPQYVGPSYPVGVSGDTVYVGSVDAWAADVGTGDLFWRTELPAGANHAVPCGDWVFAVIQGLAVIDRFTGELVHHMHHGDAFVTSPVTVSDGQVFFSTHEAVYSYRCSDFGT